MSDRKTYSYEVVTSNGHGVHGTGYRKVRLAKERAAQCAESSPSLGPYEIQRVEWVGGTVGHGGMRYWMRCRSRWVPWDHTADETVREPDWIWD